MAISNFIGENTYVMIDRLFYSPIEKRVSFNIYVYADSSKTKFLAGRDFNIYSHNIRRELKDKLDKLPPVETTEEKDIFLVNNEYLPHVREKWLFAIREPLSGRDEFFDGWSFWVPTAHEVFYMQTDQNYYKINLSTGELIRTDEPQDDVRVWNSWFTKEKIAENGLMKQCYLYLKHLQEFENCLDC